MEAARIIAELLFWSALAVKNSNVECCETNSIGRQKRYGSAAPTPKRVSMI